MFRRLRAKLESRARRFLEQGGAYGVLRAHFFRWFFDNDSATPTGDTATAAAQAMMLAALPGLALGFVVLVFMLHPLPMELGSLHDYFFVMYSFAGMGLLTVFEWEMLFADRMDFLILTPLPVQQRWMLGAKVEALGRFIGMFLVALNAGGMLAPGMAGHNYVRVVAAHCVSVAMAGSFAALLVLAVGGVMLCVLDTTTYRRVLPVVQLLVVALLVWLLLQGKMFWVAMDMPLETPPEFAQWLPSFWFLGVDERLLLGATAPEFIKQMARTGVEAWALTAALAAVTYPLAWRRKQRMAIEGLTASGRQGLGWMSRLLARAGAWQPEERAVFAFIGQSLRRNQRYQAYLTMYGGVGVALAATCVITLQWARDAVSISASDDGLHALMPLLLFWTIAGLRTAFAFPVDLGAGWVFAACGVELGRCAAAARRWVFLHGVLLAVCVLTIQYAMHWDARRLIVQAAIGVSLACVLADLFFAFGRGIPFTRPRAAGKSNVAIAVGLYAGVFPYFVIKMVAWEKELEQRPVWLWVPVAVAVALRLGLHEVQRREGLVYEVVEEDLDGTLRLGLG